MKSINVMIRKVIKSNKYESTASRINALADMIDASPYKQKNKSSNEFACELMAENRFGGIGFRSFELTNTNAEIRRLKKRLIELEKISDGFETFEVNNIYVELVDGQIQVSMPNKPNKESRSLLKSYPASLKWSSYSKKWVRKHTGSTGDNYRKALKNVLEKIVYE